ncbi:MAG: tRNA pseudouridine(38-40) synthase TruA [Bacteroidota bacterium]
MDGYRYFIYLSYSGKAYHGWQVQPGKISVQQKVEEALSVILQENTRVTGAGRTDAGVHARLFTAHFDSDRHDLAGNNNIIFRLNTLLPGDISARDIRVVKREAHARFDALSRTYMYYISLNKDPFLRDFTYYRHGNLDIDAMNRAAAYLTSHEDFTSFSKSHTQVKTNNCKIYEAAWTREKDMLVFRIKANRFLRNMVRAIVGSMIDIGSAKMPPGAMEDIIMARDRSAAGVSAPAEGLFLENIEYDSSVFL